MKVFCFWKYADILQVFRVTESEPTPLMSSCHILYHHITCRTFKSSKLSVCGSMDLTSLTSFFQHVRDVWSNQHLWNLDSYQFCTWFGITNIQTQNYQITSHISHKVSGYNRLRVRLILLFNKKLIFLFLCHFNMQGIEKPLQLQSPIKLSYFMYIYP